MKVSRAWSAQRPIYWPFRSLLFKKNHASIHLQLCTRNDIYNAGKHTPASLTDRCASFADAGLAACFIGVVLLVPAVGFGYPIVKQRVHKWLWRSKEREDLD